MRRRLVLLLALLLAPIGAASAQTLAQCESGKAEAPATVSCVAKWAEDQLAKVAADKDEMCGIVRFQGRLRQLDIDAKAIADSGRSSMLPADFAMQKASMPGTEAKARALFWGEVDEVLLTLGEDVEPLPVGACFIRSKPLAKMLEDTAEKVASFVGAYNKPMQQAGAVSLRTLSDTWQWIITDGFGQFPWERALDDALDHSAMSPFKLPSRQLIFFHPSVGAEILGGSRWTDLRSRTSLFVEPIGLLRYRFDIPNGKRDYWGLSALVVLNADEPPGVGGLLRMNKLAIGVVRHYSSDHSGLSGKWAVTATIELLERVQSARKKVGDAADNIKSRAKLGGADGPGGE